MNSINGEPSPADPEECRIKRRGLLTRNSNLSIGFITDNFVSKNDRDTKIEIQTVLDLDHNQILLFFN